MQNLIIKKPKVAVLRTKGLFEEYAEFGRGHGHDLAPFDRYHQERGLRWPVVNGNETRWRYKEAPTLRKHRRRCGVLRPRR